MDGSRLKTMQIPSHLNGPGQDRFDQGARPIQVTVELHPSGLTLNYIVESWALMEQPHVNGISRKWNCS